MSHPINVINILLEDVLRANEIVDSPPRPKRKASAEPPRVQTPDNPEEFVDLEEAKNLRVCRFPNTQCALTHSFVETLSARREASQAGQETQHQGRGRG